MNVYLKIEILARELEGRLLLALAAAERGHTVLLGHVRSLLDPQIRVPPGVFHDKSLTPKPSKLALLEHLCGAGFVVTSQDEEHGLLDEYGTYADFAEMRFSERSLELAAYSFMWGPHDQQQLRDIHPRHEDRIVATGSPRADLWRPDLAGFHRAAALPAASGSGPFVLFAGYASMVLDRNPFPTRIADQRPSYFDGPDDPKEWRFYRNCAIEVDYLGHLVRSIRHASARFPDARFVVRPHPVEADGAWESILGPLPNVTVERGGSIGSWLRSASAVIHNGSTVGLEAAAAGVPVISYQPNGERSEWVSNRLSRRAADPDDLLAAIGHALDGTAPEGGWRSAEAEALLVQRLAPLDGPLAADRIVDAWERLTVPGGSRSLRPRAALARSEVRRAASRWRSIASGKRGSGFTTSHKFPPFDRDQVAGIHRRLADSLGRFRAVEVRHVGPRLLQLRAR